MNLEANHFGQLGILEYPVNYWRKQCGDCYNAATSYIAPKPIFLFLAIPTRKAEHEMNA
jgi:hypothetical protein